MFLNVFCLMVWKSLKFSISDEEFELMFWKVLIVWGSEWKKWGLDIELMRMMFILMSFLLVFCCGFLVEIFLDGRIKSWVLVVGF